MPPLSSFHRLLHRSVVAWIAIACMAFGGLLPLSSLAVAKTPAFAMTICSTGSGWQTPGSVPAPMLHGHCQYCCGGQQPYAFDFPGGNASVFRATLAYEAAQSPVRAAHRHLLKNDSRARAPPA